MLPEGQALRMELMIVWVMVWSDRFPVLLSVPIVAKVQSVWDQVVAGQLESLCLVMFGYRKGVSGNKRFIVKQTDLFRAPTLAA